MPEYRLFFQKPGMKDGDDIPLLEYFTSPTYILKCNKISYPARIIYALLWDTYVDEEDKMIHIQIDKLTEYLSGLFPENKEPRYSTVLSLYELRDNHLIDLKVDRSDSEEEVFRIAFLYNKELEKALITQSEFEKKKKES